MFVCQWLILFHIFQCAIQKTNIHDHPLTQLGRVSPLLMGGYNPLAGRPHILRARVRKVGCNHTLLMTTRSSIWQLDFSLFTLMSYYVAIRRCYVYIRILYLWGLVYCTYGPQTVVRCCHSTLA